MGWLEEGDCRMGTVNECVRYSGRVRMKQTELIGEKAKSDSTVRRD